MISAISTAVSALESIGDKVYDRAERIARETAASPAVEDRDSKETLDPISFSDQGEDQLVNDVVGLGLDKTQFKANIAVINTAQEMERRLLDMIA